MKTTFCTLTLIASLFLFTRCSSDDIPTDLEGTYEGTFTVVYGGGETFSNPVEVTIGEGRYSSSTGPDRRPAGGEGTYQVIGSTIEFTDERVWTADYDWNLNLNGAYSFTLNGNTLVLSAGKNDVGTYTYELNRN